MSQRCVEITTIILKVSTRLVGENTGKSYKLGQTVKIRVIGTDKLVRRIDFELVDPKKEEEF